MAIVAWQPGPNRALQVPSEEELSQLRPGEVVRREPPSPPQPTGSQRSYGQQALGKSLSGSSAGGGAQGPGAEPGAEMKADELTGGLRCLCVAGYSGLSVSCCESAVGDGGLALHCE